MSTTGVLHVLRLAVLVSEPKIDLGMFLRSRVDLTGAGGEFEPSRFDISGLRGQHWTKHQKGENKES